MLVCVDTPGQKADSRVDRRMNGSVIASVGGMDGRMHLFLLFELVSEFVLFVERSLVRASAPSI